MKPKIITIILLFIVLAGCTNQNTGLSQPFEPTFTSPATTFEVEFTPGIQQTIPAPSQTSTEPAIEATATPEATPLPSPTATSVPPSETLESIKLEASIIADHNVVEQFDQIPESALAAASQIQFMFRGSSIAHNINFGLDCLWGNFPERRPNACSDFFALKYDRSNWDFQIRGNPGWLSKVRDFVDQVNTQVDNFKVFGFLVDYVDGQDGMGYPVISDPENFQTRFVEPIEVLEAQYPDKIFIWSTMSLARTGFENEEKFNTMLRQYALETGKVFFDLADIESHDPSGSKATNEMGYEVIYEGYTNEVHSGHLNEAGSERVAKTIWWLMARISGWDGQ